MTVLIIPRVFLISEFCILFFGLAIAAAILPVTLKIPREIH